MALLKISEALSKNIAEASESLLNLSQKEIEQSLKHNQSFLTVFQAVNKILSQNDFVIVNNIGFNNNKPLLEAFIKLFGNFYGQNIEHGKIKIECDHAAGRYNLIQLHTDDAVAVEKDIPTVGFIQVIKEDPLKLAKNGFVKVDDIVSHLTVYNDDLLNQLKNHKMPLLSYGINYESNNKEEILMEESILYDIKNLTYIRFDLGRIKHFYWKKKIKQSIKEQKIIMDFLKVCQMVRQEFYLEVGDIAVYNNKRVLHDRTSTAMELNSDGTINGREIFVGFATR